MTTENEGTSLPSERHFTYEGWDVRISIARISPEGYISGHVDLWKDGHHKCRISLAGNWSLPEEAAESLALRARSWADEWALRDHHGNSDFADL